MPNLVGKEFWIMEDPKVGNEKAQSGVPNTINDNHYPLIPIKGCKTPQPNGLLVSGLKHIDQILEKFIPLNYIGLYLGSTNLNLCNIIDLVNVYLRKVIQMIQYVHIFS